MSIKVDIFDGEGNRKSINSALNIAARTRRGAQRAFYYIGKDLIAEFNKQVLAKDKSGSLYLIRRKGGTFKKHTASAPGQTPANITGKYRKGIGFIVQGNQLVFGNSTDYSGFLERGTKRMKARPGLANTLKSSERNIIRDLSRKIEDSI